MSACRLLLRNRSSSCALAPVFQPPPGEAWLAMLRSAGLSPSSTSDMAASTQSTEMTRTTTSLSWGRVCTEEWMPLASCSVDVAPTSSGHGGRATVRPLVTYAPSAQI
eukprot:6478102-Prymnesium_polylepis.1